MIRDGVFSSPVTRHTLNMNRGFYFFVVLALGLHGLLLFGITLPTGEHPKRPAEFPSVDVVLVEARPVVVEPPAPLPKPPEPQPPPPAVEEPKQASPPEPVQETPPPQPIKALPVQEPVAAPPETEFAVAATTDTTAQA